MGAITIYTGSPHLIDRPRPSLNPRIVYPDIKNADTDWAMEQAAKCSDILSGMLGITPEEAAKRYGRRSIKVNRDGDGKVTDISLEYLNHMDDLQDFMIKRLATWVTRLYFADTSKDQLQAIILGSFWPEADIKFADFVFAQVGKKNISLTMQNPSFHFINQIRYLTATDYEHKPNICLFHFAAHGRSKPIRSTILPDSSTRACASLRISVAVIRNLPALRCSTSTARNRNCRTCWLTNTATCFTDRRLLWNR